GVINKVDAGHFRRAINAAGATTDSGASETSAPSVAAISPSTPAIGPGTSMVTLSVSSSISGLSTAAASPSFLNHLPILASITDSPRAGTRIPAMVIIPHWRDRWRRDKRVDDGGRSQRSGGTRHLSSEI